MRRWIPGQARDDKGTEGFTLVELLLVMIIMAILVTIGITSFMSSQKKSRDITRKNDLRQIGLALETYYNDKGQYPMGTGDGRIAGCGALGDSICEWRGMFQLGTDGTIYMVVLPGDSNADRRYFYISDGLYYQLYARLENKLDIDLPKDPMDDKKSRVFTDLDCSTNASNVYCNYGVASTNVRVDYNYAVEPDAARPIAYE